MTENTYMPNGSLMPPEGETEATPSAEAAEHKAKPCPFCGGKAIVSAIGFVCCGKDGE